MNKNDWFYRQRVTEGEMDTAFDNAELADQAVVADLGLSGIVSGMGVEETAPASLSVTIAAGVAYDQDGQRIEIPLAFDQDCSVDVNNVSTAVVVPGNKKILSVFVAFDRALSNPRLDGNNVNVYYDVDESYQVYVEQSAEGADPPPTGLKSDALLLCDITLLEGDTSIVNAAIDYDRRQVVFSLSSGGGALEVTQGKAEDAMQGILDALYEHTQAAADAHVATAINYAGGGAWADGTTNPAATVEAQLDKVISDLAALAGSDRIGAAEIDQGAPFVLTDGSIASQMAEMLTLHKLHVGSLTAHSATVITNSPSGQIASTNVQDAINELDTEKGGLATNNTWTGTNTYNNTVTSSTTLAANDVTTAGTLTINGLATMANSAILQLLAATQSQRTHNGTTQENLSLVRFYTGCVTNSGVTVDTILSIPTATDMSYVCLAITIGTHVLGGGASDQFSQFTVTHFYNEAGAVTIPGGWGNIIGNSYDTSGAIVNVDATTSGTNVLVRVDHTGSPQNIRATTWAVVLPVAAT